MLAVKNIIPCQLIPSPSNSEVVCIRLNSMTCCVSYNPPNSSSANCNNLLNCISNISNSSDRLVLLGNFNFPDINWDTLSGNSPVYNQLCDLIFSSSLSQIVEPTHIHGNVFGLENFHSLKVHLSLSLSFDHYDITFTVVTIHKPLPNLYLIIYLIIPKVTTLVSAIIHFILTLQLVFSPCY